MEALMGIAVVEMVWMQSLFRLEYRRHEMNSEPIEAIQKGTTLSLIRIKFSTMKESGQKGDSLSVISLHKSKSKLT